jgi:hypothetical protein
MEISQGNSLCSYLSLEQAKTSCFAFYLLYFFFYKIGEQEFGTSPAQGVGGRGSWNDCVGEVTEKGGGRVNMM